MSEGIGMSTYSSPPLGVEDCLGVVSRELAVLVVVVFVGEGVVFVVVTATAGVTVVGSPFGVS